MAYASQSGRARTSARNPRAFAVCMRCGIWYNRDQLTFQFDWRGAQLQNLYILVCRECLDTPQEQLRAIVLPPDPVPIFYPSVEDFAGDETDYRATSPPQFDPITGLQIPNSQSLRVTQNCENRTTQPIGAPQGLEQNAIPPLEGTTAYGVPINVVSVSANGTCIVTVTCGAFHNLLPNYQISAAGLAAANGFYSVTPLGATTFTYQTPQPVPSGPLLQPGARIVNCNVGLPYGYTQVPNG
jgi:hypothetical protein